MQETSPAEFSEAVSWTGVALVVLMLSIVSF
jgi:hypothetical protein